jgi:hypothetical protein
MTDISTTSPGATCNILCVVIILNIPSELFNAHENIQVPHSVNKKESESSLLPDLNI